MPSSLPCRAHLASLARACAWLALSISLLAAAASAAQLRSVAFQADERAAGSFRNPIAQYTPDPSYPERARRAGIRGSVVLRILIGPDGCAHHIRLLQRLGWGLDQAAIEAVRAWRFRRPHGVATGVPARIELSFSPNMPEQASDDLTPCTESVVRSR